MGLRAMLIHSTSARHRIRHGIRHTAALAGRRPCPCVANGRLRQRGYGLNQRRNDSARRGRSRFKGAWHGTGVARAMKRRNIQRPFLGLYGHDEPHTNKHRDSDPVNTAVRSCLSLCGQGTWCAACHSRARRCASLRSAGVIRVARSSRTVTARSRSVPDDREAARFNHV